MCLGFLWLRRGITPKFVLVNHRLFERCGIAPDCEADDVIGYLCKYKLSDWKKVIVSSDKDFYQLLDKNTLINGYNLTKVFPLKYVNNQYVLNDTISIKTKNYIYKE